MKKLLLSLLLLVVGCVHHQKATVVIPKIQQSIVIPQPTDIPKNGDTMVIVGKSDAALLVYDQDSITKNGEMVSFLSMIVFDVQVDDPKTPIGATGRIEIDCMKVTSKVVTNYLLNNDYQVISIAEVDKDFTVIDEESPIRLLYEMICNRKFSRPIET